MSPIAAAGINSMSDFDASTQRMARANRESSRLLVTPPLCDSEETHASDGSPFHNRLLAIWIYFNDTPFGYWIYVKYE